MDSDTIGSPVRFRRFTSAEVYMPFWGGLRNEGLSAVH